MHIKKPVDISKFGLVGISYKKTDASFRGKYAINNEQYENILSNAGNHKLKELFILSTCNRTEMYGFADDHNLFSELICTETDSSLDEFNKIAYFKSGLDAVKHLFSVAAGLDSQILGDYEVVGQIKQAVKFAKEKQFVGTNLERLINNVFKSSKEIKTNTSLSGGTVSVSFAAVQFIKETVSEITDKKLLLIGTGKIGRNTCKNLVDYLNTKNITLINRTDEKAAVLANDLGLQYDTHENIAERIKDSDIILLATNAKSPIIFKSHLENNGNKLIIDLSVPYNVETEAQQLPNIKLINVDDLSRIKDTTLLARKKEIPKAESIIQKHINDFLNWHEMRQKLSVLHSVKSKLLQLPVCHISNMQVLQQNPAPAENLKEEKIQKIINGLAVKIRNQNNNGCLYLEAINEFISEAKIG